jgi:hypothetical protein
MTVSHGAAEPLLRAQLCAPGWNSAFSVSTVLVFQIWELYQLSAATLYAVGRIDVKTLMRFSALFALEN